MSTPPNTPTIDANQALRREAWHFARVIICVLVAVSLLKAFVVESCPVHGPSMLPLLHENERILVLKLPTTLSRLPGFGWLSPARQNDLVVFASAEENNKHYIKRVIAMGPERPAGAVNAATQDAKGNPIDAVHVLYDHGKVYINNHLLDEPYLLETERNSPIVHEAWLDAGQYYVMGDHRSVSKDTRRLGPIQREQIVGRAFFRFWPLSKLGFL